jgi:SAM-dependent methyltransferase
MNLKNINFLEIGYGYGNIFNWINNNTNFNYCGIDVLKRINGKTLYETNGWDIPNEITKIDIVYSINVFQHLSEKQRINYFEKIYKILNYGGVFYCSMFILNNENKDKNCWSFTDGEKYYCNLFGQLTEVDEERFIFDIIKNIGYKIIEKKYFEPNLLYFKLNKDIY